MFRTFLFLIYLVQYTFLNPVIIQVHSKWSASSFLIQTSEYFAEYHYEEYWKFLDLISTSNQTNIQPCSLQDYQLSIDLAERVIPSIVGNLKLSLGIYDRLPKIEFYQNVAKIKNIDYNCEHSFILNEVVFCGFDQLTPALESLYKDYSSEKSHDWDRVYNLTFVNNSSPLLYYLQDLSHPEFGLYHSKLREMAHQQKIRYMFWPLVKSKCPEKVRLGGYRALLNIKNSAYNAIDDEPINLYGESLPSVLTNNTWSTLYNDDTIEEPIKDSDYAVYIVKAMKYISNIEPDNRLGKMVDLIENLPVYMKELNKVQIKNTDNKEFQHYKQVLSQIDFPNDDQHIFINGNPISDDTSPFQLISIFGKEIKILDNLKSLHLKPSESIDVLMKGISNEKNTVKLNIQSPYILWLNNVEKDNRYSGMSRSVSQFSYFNFGETFYPVRLNIFNVVVFMDPFSSAFSPTLTLMHRMISNNFPIRFGIVIVNHYQSRASRAFSRAFYSLMNKSRTASAMTFLHQLFEEGKELELDRVIEKYRKFDSRDATLVGLDSKHPSDPFLKESKAFFNRLGLSHLPTLVFNGEILGYDSIQNDLFYTIVSHYKKIVSEIRKKLFSGTMKIAKNTEDTFMSGPGFYNRLNMDIIQNNKDIYFLYPVPVENCDTTEKLNRSQLYHCFLKDITYISNSDDSHQTIYLVLDLESEAGVQVLAKYISTTFENPPRVAIVFSNIPKVQQVTRSDIVMDYILNHNDDLTMLNESLYASIEEYSEKLNVSELRSHFNLHLIYKNLLNVKDSASYVVHGGRTFGPIDNNFEFECEDFVLLTDMHENTYSPLFQENSSDMISYDDLIKYHRLTRLDVLDLITTAVSQRSSSNRFEFPDTLSKFTRYHIHSPPRPDSMFIDVVALLNPFSESSLKWIPLFYLLQKSINLNIMIYMQTNEFAPSKLTPYFSRYVIQSDTRFINGTIDPLFNTAVFEKLPHDKVYTLHVDTLQNWFIESTFSNCDMDNIVLYNAPQGCIGMFDLEYLMLEGHAYNIKKGGPASGLQLVLGNQLQPNKFDTIVIHNLGYFQFKGDAGLFELKLKEGNSSKNFKIESISSIGSGSSHLITIDNFRGQILKLDVIPRDSAHQTTDSDEDTKLDEEGWLERMFKYFKPPKSKPVTEGHINIFSVATGLMYERFMRIMMLSVLEHTKTPVKFWFLKNYLSSQFAKSIKIMAEKYKFDYEFVQYKWPHWLLKQTDKQRIIWGYKILFLDVLFPLDVERIIFVDADQIVRTDLNELYQMDLGNAPYAYTPFCDDRSEMDRFRFWKKGYWRQHLQGKPYHISALYVVDLRKFRQMMAGDRIRGQYQMLSQDPNSLANLDQDLPNNIQDIVPIKSLPVEWLWCETWCSDRSKARAKTIDMCNNPLTYEAKLDRAKRIAPEWVTYDEIIHNLISNATGSPIEDIGDEGTHSDL